MIVKTAQALYTSQGTRKFFTTGLDEHKSNDEADDGNHGDGDVYYDADDEGGLPTAIFFFFFFTIMILLRTSSSET